MAGDATQQANVLCKKCGSKVVNFVKCKLFQHQFHPSCAKILNATFHDNKSITCCDEIIWENVSPQLFSYIIKEKDALIEELRDKIALLQICIQEKNKSLSPKKHSPIIAGQSPPAHTVVDNKSAGRNKNEIKNKDKLNKVVFEKDQLQAQSNTTATKIFENNKKSMPRRETPKNEDPIIEETKNAWKTITHKKLDRKQQRNAVIGTHACDKIKTAPKKAFLYVSRLDPETKSED
ncbi:hypothetical protein TcasGA2_TC004039 [Tribolium castaneum]|uniref:Uncharacterized protein n=1 Tax=Tribolium castaneum TaxID=7070 RepID=D7EKR9_TRICA|nr:hypothetical protein TcasGA2_TC004039 [Tribolium castaneum]